MTHSSLSGRTVVVTGGAGFIGHHLVRSLLKAGALVRVIDDLSSGDRSRLAGLGRSLKFIEGSILDPRALNRALKGADAVLHEAAMVSVPQSLEQPELCYQLNVEGTLRVLDAAARLGVKRVVMASSCAVYGDAPADVRREDQAPAPTSVYGVSKLALEHLAQYYAAYRGLETIALRYFNVFGPGQPASGGYAAVVPAFCLKILAGQSPLILGKGAQTRDFVFVQDVVAANLLALTTPNARGQALNVGTGRSTSILELAHAVAEAAGVKIEPVFGPAREGDILDSCADISRARRALGYKPAMGLVAGLAETLAWYRASALKRPRS